MDYSKFLTPFWIQREKEIEEYFSDGDYSKFWECPGVNHAMVMHGRYLGTTSAHLNHLHRWQEHTGKTIEDIKSVIEVGGGYGSMCRVFKGCNDCFYSIIDLPVINNVQRYFLRREQNVSYIGLDRLEALGDMECDLFISTFALNEAGAEFIRYILERKFFKAKHLLLLYYVKDTDCFKFEEFLKEIESAETAVRMNEHKTYIMR